MMPAVLMPSPNAFDTFNDAYAVYQDPEKINQPNSHAEPGLPAAASLVARNRAAIALVRKGLKQAYCEPPCRSFNTPFPFFGHDRALARLLVLDARTRAASSDWSGAMDSCLDAEQLGAAIQHGNTLIALLVGISCEETANRAAQPMIGRLRASSAIAAARRLDSIDRSQESLSDALQKEEWFVQASLTELFRQPDGAQAFLHDAGYHVASPISLLIAMEPFDTVWDSYTHYNNRCIAVAKLPYQTRVHTSTGPLPIDPIGSVISPVFMGAGGKLAAATCSNRFLETQLALRAYFVDHGRYPASLAALAPRYIPAVPNDPFADAGPLRYRLAGARYVLYSVGPDGIDDGGKPITLTTNGRADPHRLIDESARGDFVAGVNY
ncbi:MAG: hypothetical protein P4L33_03105 [Capsulimonadaceae bacterium]|nr:hypothetical protein [Capsulimonadaceae bacterium]